MQWQPCADAVSDSSDSAVSDAQRPFAQEFKTCLRSAALGLSRKDINMLMSKVDVDADGLVTYAEFLPICFSILVERFADQMLASEVLSQDDTLVNAVLQRFEAVGGGEGGGGGGNLMTMRQIKQVRAERLGFPAGFGAGPGLTTRCGGAESASAQTM